ncbi:MAG: ABC transporter substrate-binding protein [Oscillospiraceae bacterium]|nr:ABC transporter substrate-binding protein [Oscillospiraceae bacterium]
MKKILSLTMISVLLLACAAELSGCGKEGRAENAGAAMSVSDTAEAGRVVSVGVYEPASGADSMGGKRETLGIRYANEVRPTVELDGVTYNVELKFVDNESSPEIAAAAAEELAESDCSVILGSYGSEMSVAGIPAFTEAGVAAVGATCSAPQVTEGNDCYFRICYSDSFQGVVLAHYAYSCLGVTKAYCLSEQENGDSARMADAFAATFHYLGGTCIQASYPAGTTDFTEYISAAQKAVCGVLFCPTPAATAPLIIEQAETMSLLQPILAGDDWDTGEVLKAAVGKSVSVTVTTPYLEGADPAFDAAVRDWIRSDRTNVSENGGDSTVTATTALGYDAYFVALDALERAGSTDPVAVRAAMWSTDTTGVTGEIRFDGTGDAVRTGACIKRANPSTGDWDYITTQSVL